MTSLQVLSRTFKTSYWNVVFMFVFVFQCASAYYDQYNPERPYDWIDGLCSDDYNKAHELRSKVENGKTYTGYEAIWCR